MRGARLPHAPPRSRVACWCMLLAWGLALTVNGSSRGLNVDFSPIALSGALSSPTQQSSEEAEIVTDDMVLQLCECENASMDSNGGLNCDKEGWFITSFEMHGRWMAGGGYVPLSRAQCCRLCAPQSLPADIASRLPAGTTPATIISVGCHASTVASLVACEPSSSDFLTGFQSAVAVPTSAANYPEGPAVCCTPVLMLSTGDAWEIARCNCVWSQPADTGCSGARLIQGYADARHGMDRQPVPVAPTRCCSACLGQRVHPLDRCETLDFCNQRGVCVMGVCSCNSGWGGADCSKQLRGGGWLPQWLQYILMAASVILSTVAWAVVHKIMTDWTERRRIAQEEANAALDPLLVQEGSVGDDDTDDEGEETVGAGAAHFQVPSPTSAASPQIPSALASVADTDLMVQQMTTRQRDEIASALARHASLSGAQQTELVARFIQTPPPDASESVVAKDEKDLKSGDDEGLEEEEPMDPELAAYLAQKFDERKSPLSGIKCAICCDKPVQVALVPCGHSNLCRRCARRLSECPFCRKVIVRRQRLYIAE